jgi:hypothetical protein
VNRGLDVNAQPKGSAIQQQVRQVKLWFGLVGGALAWLAHLMIAYAVAEFGCVGGMDSWHALGISVVAWIVIAVSAITFVIASVAAIMAYRIGLLLSGLEKHQSTAAIAGETYAAKAGWLTSGLFALVIAVETVPILYFLREC